MDKVLTVRIDSRTRRRLAQIARRRKQSEVVREAVQRLLDQVEERPFDSWEPCLGLFEGPRDLSERTGRRFARLLHAPSRPR